MAFESTCQLDTSIGTRGKIFESLRQAHALDVIHGDFKERNVLVKDNEYRIIDWETYWAHEEGREKCQQFTFFGGDGRVIRDGGLNGVCEELYLTIGEFFFWGGTCHIPVHFKYLWCDHMPFDYASKGAVCSRLREHTHVENIAPPRHRQPNPRR